MHFHSALIGLGMACLIAIVINSFSLDCLPFCLPHPLHQDVLRYNSEERRSMVHIFRTTISEGYSHLKHLSRGLMAYRALLPSWYKFNFFFFMIAICYTSLPLACCFLVNPIIYMRKAIWRSSIPSASHHPIYILTIGDLLMASALSTSLLHWCPTSQLPTWIHSVCVRR